GEPYVPRLDSWMARIFSTSHASLSARSEGARRSQSELVDRRSWPTKAEARQAVFEFIETFYSHSVRTLCRVLGVSRSGVHPSNRPRRPSTRGSLSPAEYEKIATTT